MGLYYLKVTRIIIGHAQDLNDEQGKKFFYCNPFKKIVEIKTGLPLIYSVNPACLMYYSAVNIL